MATYYVAGSGSDSSGNGSSGNPWRSLGKAHQQISAGDTVVVRNGTYNEQLLITKANTTWQVDTGHEAIVDGRYHIGLMSGSNTITKQSTMPKINSSGTFIPGGTNSKAPLIGIQANGITVRGFIVQNSTGSGISISASNATIEDNFIYFTYGSGIMSNPSGNISGLRVRRNTVMFASVKIFDTARFTDYAGKCSAQCVDGAMKFGNNIGNTIIEDNEVAYSFGEGINIGKYVNATASSPIIVRRNRVHDVNHSHLYVNASRFVHLDSNLVYNTNVSLNMWDGDAPVGIRLADEKETYLRDVFIYNNIVVNMGYSIEIGGRHTEATGVYAGFNTFVGGPNSRKPAVFVVKSEPATGYAGGFNQRGLIENNVIDYSMASSLAVANTNNTTGANGITWRNNNWSKNPPTAASGAGDVIGLPRLTRNNRTLATSNYFTKASTSWTLVTVSDNLDENDYKLTSSSPGLSQASNGTAASGVTPPSQVSKDYFGANRDATPANRDLGAAEFGGVVTNNVIADFSGTPRSGAATLAVTFTDLSEEFGAATINSWSWNFGDGGTSTAQNPTHNYTAPGTYTVSLTVQDTGLSLTDTLSRTGYIVVGSAPANSVTANFSGAPQSGAANLTVAFTNLSSVGGSAVINSYAWNFGDGGTSTLASPSHTYTAPGTYTVTLTVQDTVLGLSDGETKTGYITVAAANTLTADFSYTPSTGEMPLTVAFTDESVEGGAAAIDSWEWDFGDGETSTAQHPSHEYTEAGVYTATLTVADSALGITDSVSIGPITVTSPPDPTLAANFTTVGSRVGFIPFTVEFRDLSGGPVVSWLWDFGDGVTSTAQNPSHEYTTEGNFDVTLTVTDASLNTSTRTEPQYITAEILVRRRYRLGPMLARDTETVDGNSVTHYDFSDDADSTHVGYLDVATNRARPILRLTAQG